MQRLFIAPVLAVLVLTLAACGSSNSSPGSTAGTSAATTEATADTTGGAAQIGTTKGDLGEYLVDGQGNTVYLFEQDTGSTSTCSGQCAQVWPPVITTGAPTATGAADASKLGTTKRTDGTVQVTYGGHPLYTYTPDGGPGKTTGQGVDSFGAEWYVVAPSGGKLEAAEQPKSPSGY